MKKLFGIISIVLIVLLSLSACSVSFDKIDKGAVIGVVTPQSEMGSEYAVALKIQEEYGADQVLIETYDADYNKSADTIAVAAMNLAKNPDVKAIVFTRGSTGVSAAMTLVKKERSDIECICVNYLETEAQISATADLGLTVDNHEVYHEMVKAAKKAKLETVAFLIPQKYKNNTNIVDAKEMLQHVCEDEGLGFETYEITYTSIAPNNLKSAADKVVKEAVIKHSNNVAFFTPSCIVKDAVINAAAENDAGYIYTTCNCPRNHYLSALAISGGETYAETIEAIKSYASEFITGKFAVLDIDPVETLTKIAVNYAIAIANGDVDADEINMKVLESAGKSAVKDTDADKPTFATSEKSNNIVKVGFSASSF